ncbi:hypothetical protein EV424DRAFT_723498 [Suillus variegatus]|nr:hypothetical protein EV424DRAFT_723498 [Suillus variegatus]
MTAQQSHGIGNKNTSSLRLSSSSKAHPHVITYPPPSSKCWSPAQPTAQSIPATANRTTISGTRAGALEALQQNTWVHLACHGKQDPTQPYNSHFVTRDEHLTLLDIMEKHLPQAEFASLTACHTAVGDTVLSLPTIQELSISPRTGLFGPPSPARRVSFDFWNA